MAVFSNATLTPDTVPAGDSVEFVIRLEAGADYTKGPSRLILDCMATLGTSVPTRLVNEASGYVEAYVENPAVSWDVRIWDLDYDRFAGPDCPASMEASRFIVLDLSEGMREGDSLEIHWGETLGGFGPGTKVTTVVPRPDWQSNIEVRYFEGHDRGLPDPGGTFEGLERPAPDSSIVLKYRVLPREPARLRLLHRNDGTLLLPYDRFWNIAAVDSADAIVEASGDFRRNQHNAFFCSDRQATVRTKSLPLSVSPEMTDVHDGMNIYWGDLHSHSMHSIDCIRRSRMDMSPAMLMDFARHRAGLDFYAVTDHHIPHPDPMRRLPQWRWDDTLRAIGEHHQDGRFVVFAGIEFTDDFGDICLLFDHLPGYADISGEELLEVSDFASRFGRRMMAIPHLHSFGERPEGAWREGIENVSPVLEMYSDHGSYEREDVCENGRAWCKPFRQDHCGQYFLARGLRYGLVANSDDHKGHVGVSGLTAVYARELTREAIWKAYYNRNVYGTTNARIRLLFLANGELMGCVLPETPRKTLFIDVRCENRIKKVELLRNNEIRGFYTSSGTSLVREETFDSEGPDFWYVRVTQIDNHVAYSSPTWFE